MMPSPTLSAGLFVVWLLLANGIDAGQMVLAALFALLLPWLLRRLLPARAQRQPVVALKLLATVLGDIVMSNLAVAAIILRPTVQAQPAFVEVPLTLSSPQAITLLAGIITLTPGTVSVDLSPQRDVLWVHALDCADPQALVAGIKQRYEAPLLALYPC